jgi:hypothetical protein
MWRRRRQRCEVRVPVRRERELDMIYYID